MTGGISANGITIAWRKSIAGVSWRIDLCCAVVAASLVGPHFAGVTRDHHALQDAKRFGVWD